MSFPDDPKAIFGPIDIYLFDQLLKGRIPKGTRLLDAGCGRGRNLLYFLRRKDDVWGVDRSCAAIESLRQQAIDLGYPDAHLRFAEGDLLQLPHAGSSFAVVISNAVLHFAADEDHFLALLDEAWRVLRPGGLFFARLASSIGIEETIEALSPGRFRLPDGSERFLVDSAFLKAQTARLHGSLLDPIKTTNVDGLRCMTTWVVKKDEAEQSS